MRRNILKRLMVYICVPLVFTFITLGLVYLIGAPIISPVAAVVDMMTKKQPTSFDDDEFTSIFDPNVSESPVSHPEDSQEQNTIKASDIMLPAYGTLYGELAIDGTRVKADVYFGDSNAILKKGLGHYAGSSYPGCGSTVLVSGHNHTFFNGLQEVTEGDIITFRTNYGTYTYKVTEMAVKKAKDSTAYDLSANYENLILYTCYPFDTLGLTPNRYFVYAEYVSGPKILINE